MTTSTNAPVSATRPDLKCDVRDVRVEPAVRLPVHGLGPQRGCDQIHCLRRERRDGGGVGRQHLHLDQRVLLQADVCVRIGACSCAFVAPLIDAHTHTHTRIRGSASMLALRCCIRSALVRVYVCVIVRVIVCESGLRL